MGKSILSLLSVMIFISVSALFGETTLSSLEEIAAYAIEHNLDYQSSRINVLKAEGNQTGIFKLEDMSISATGLYNETGQDGDKWGFSSTLNVPIIDQLSISGTIEDDLSGQVGIILSPLAHSDERSQSKITYNAALINSEGTKISSESKAVSSALNWMVSKRDYETREKLTALKKISYSDDKIRYESGEITLDDLQESLIEWSQARIELSQKEQIFHNSESTLYKELGSGKAQVEIKTLSNEEILESLKTIKKNLMPEEGNPYLNNDYQISLLNVSSAEVSNKNTWSYEPDIQASANLSYNNAGALNVSAALKISFSLDQIQILENSISEKELQIAILEAEQIRYEAELDFQQVIDTISSSQINREISELEMEQAENLYSEALLLHQLGEYSQVELELISVTLQQAENSYFQMIANEYMAWIDLKRYL